MFAICSASSDATIAANPFTVEPRTVNSASVDCPAGKRAVGGGVHQPGATNPLFGWVQSSGPVDATGTTANTDSGDVAEGWYASVFNFGATERDFHVFAICSAGSDATIAAKVFSVAPGNVGDATVACPAGKRVVGGGVGQPAATNAPAGYIQESAPVDVTGETANTDSGEVGRSWFASVYNPPEVGAPTREFRAFAICASEATTTPKPTTTAPLPTTTHRRRRRPARGNPATIVGTAGNDVLTGTSAPGRNRRPRRQRQDPRRGGNDLICGGDGNDTSSEAPATTTRSERTATTVSTASTGRDNHLRRSRQRPARRRHRQRPPLRRRRQRLPRGRERQRPALRRGRQTTSSYGGPGLDSLDGGPGQNTVQP